MCITTLCPNTHRLSSIYLFRYVCQLSIHICVSTVKRIKRNIGLDWLSLDTFFWLLSWHAVVDFRRLMWTNPEIPPSNSIHRQSVYHMKQRQSTYLKLPFHSFYIFVIGFCFCIFCLEWIFSNLWVVRVMQQFVAVDVCWSSLFFFIELVFTS